MATRFYFSATGVPYPNNLPNLTVGNNFWSEATKGQGATGRLTTQKTLLNTPNVTGKMATGLTNTINGFYNMTFVSDPIAKQIVGGVGYFSGQLMVREYAGTDNVAYVVCVLRIVDKFGTQRGTIRDDLSDAGSNPAAELINNATHRNRRFANLGTMSAVQAFNEDRIIAEIGYYTLSGTTPQCTARWGEEYNDLTGNNNTQTLPGRGWIEWPDNIVFWQPPKVLHWDDETIALV